jgi:hypothetical protein
VEVAFSFLDFGSLGLLVGIYQPLEVVFLELTYIRMVLLLSNLDALIPSVELLVHSHGLLHFIILKKDSLGTMELLVKNSEFGLDSEVFKALLRNKLVDLSEVVGLRDVSESGIASFGNIQVLLLQGKLGESLPVGLDFRSHI